ncbi:hypothetical protein Hesp01_07700 [Herbidospora sp. NBRC 101105]|nr:hypothetical protein Hesp01_07700 [Herbidospora sp. NBRC 101105]
MRARVTLMYRALIASTTSASAPNAKTVIPTPTTQVEFVNTVDNDKLEAGTVARPKIKAMRTL